MVGEISKYGEKLRKNGLNIKHLVQVNDEELADEILEKRRKVVLKRIDEIAALEAKAQRSESSWRVKKESKKIRGSYLNWLVIVFPWPASFAISS